jgi:hypothetical protein
VSAIVTFARARADEAKERDRRVDAIVEVMTEGKWSAREAKRYAESWGCSLDAIRSYAREASSVIRRAFSTEDREELRTAIVLRAERVFDEAMGRQRATADGALVPDPDLKAAIAALKLVGDVQAVVVQRHEVTEGPKLGDDEIREKLSAFGFVQLDGLTDDQLAERGLRRVVALPEVDDASTYR